MTDPSRPANRLADETSPYLLQHAHNPVDWYPWGEQALARAREEQKPIFLSVGYSACHWCHVMERESFEDNEVAAILNDHFINVKVDREERPDLDQIYMNYLMARTGHGGWPMSVFLTPDLHPFYGGTYFPPEDRFQMPSFRRVLTVVRESWAERRDQIIESASELTERLALNASMPPGDGEFGLDQLEKGAADLIRAFDPVHGGFGGAPKFPHPMSIRFLLRHAMRGGPSADEAGKAALVTLDRMARGGIYDHLGGGFARYSTDDRWLVPHFEKMLYDNALLIPAYVEAYQWTGEEAWADVARETIDYILDRMTGPEGAFYATEDADSEGVEGKYYVWSRAEIAELLGPDRIEEFAYVFDVTESGNWEHTNILHRPKSWTQLVQILQVEESELRQRTDADRAKLLEARAQRIPPGKDTKVLTSWNGLMIAALADSAWALGRPEDLGAAEKAAGFLLETLIAEDGRLRHSYKDGRARFDGTLDDYANLIDGLTRLFEATGHRRWLDAATSLADRMHQEFGDPEGHGYFYTGSNHERLIYRLKDSQDNATPSGNAMAATALLRLARLTDRRDLHDAAISALRAVQVIVEEAPMAAGQSLIALDFLMADDAIEIAVAPGSDDLEPILRAIHRRFLPHKVLAVADPQDPAPIGLLKQRPARDDHTTVYVCHDYVCREPVVGVDALDEALTGDAPSS